MRRLIVSAVAAFAFLSTAADPQAESKASPVSRRPGPPTALGTLAASMRPGTWAELKTENLVQKLFSDGGHYALQYADELMWDPNTRMLLFSGDGHLSAYRFIKYEELTHRWTNMPLPQYARTAFAHPYDHQAIARAARTCTPDS